MPESPVSVEVPDQSLFSRAVGIVVSPAHTFRTVVAVPRPAAMLFIVALVIGLSTSLPQFTAHGRQLAVDQMMQRNEQAGQMSPDAVARMEQFAPYLPYFTLASTFIALPIFSMIFAGIYWAIFNTVLGGTADFKQVLGVVTHASVIGALGQLVSAPLLFFSDAPPSMAGPFNLGALVPMLDPSNFLHRWLAFLSVFMLWQVVVSAIGLGVLYKRRSTGIATALLIVYLAVTAGVAAAFPSLSSR